MRKSRQQGHSLTEILISLSLSTLLLSLLLQQFVTSRQQYQRVQESLDRQNDVQLVVELLRNSVRRAGFTPCGNINRLHGYDRTQDGVSLKDIRINAQKNGIIISRMGEQFSLVRETIKGNELLVRGQGYRRGQLIAVSDCLHAEVQRIKKSMTIDKGQLLELEQNLKYNYSPTSYLGLWFEEQFYIKNKQNHPSLYYHLNHSEELSVTVNNLYFEEIKLQSARLLKMMIQSNDGSKTEVLSRIRSS